MSLDRCSTCKNVCFCALPRSRVITQCDEFIDMSTAPAFDWDLQDLLELCARENECAE